MENKIKEIINNKLKEHSEEATQTIEEITKLQKQAASTTDKEKQIELVKQVMVIKDKMLFHKSCEMVLNELLGDIHALHDPKN